MEKLILPSPVAAVLGRYLYYLLMAILVLNLVQRKHMATGRNKRLATLYMAVAVLAFMAASLGIARLSRSDLLLVPAAAALGVLVFLNRGRLFPFRLRCRRCGARLDMDRILYHDSNRCADCDRETPAADNTPGT